MGKKKHREVYGRAMVEATQEATTLMQALLSQLLKRVLETEGLSEAERAHLAGTQMLVILSIINHHLAQIGDKNFEVLMRQVQELIKRERVDGTHVAGLAKLSALLLPLQSLQAPLKN